MAGCAKVMIIFFNVLIAIIGLILGIVSAVQASKDTAGEGAVGGAVFGFLVFGIAFLAFLGAALESRCLLITYMVLISVMMLAKFGFATYAIIYVTSGGYKDYLMGPRNDQRVGWASESEDVSKSFNGTVFEEYKKKSCCGCEGAGNAAAWTCLDHAKTDCCDLARDAARVLWIVIASIMFTGVVIEILAICFAWCMSNDIKKRPR